jgi:hypothetical protein
MQCTTQAVRLIVTVSPDSDLLKDLRASVAAQRGLKNSPREPSNTDRFPTDVVDGPSCNRAVANLHQAIHRVEAHSGC